MVSAASFAGGRGGSAPPNFNQCRVVNGTFSGKYEQGLIRGDVDGDIKGVLSSEVRVDLEGRTGYARMTGTGKLASEEGTLVTIDDVRLIPSRVPDVMIWIGHHKIQGVEGDLRGAQGFMISEGLVDLSTGEVKYQFKALLCPPD
jgi:hypothetical protein